MFHDVDLIPEDARHFYGCLAQPLHLGSAVDAFDYRWLYRGLFGGVTAMTPEQLILVNGWSNNFRGWGGEDDDMGVRITKAGMQMLRLPNTIAKYTTIRHRKSRPNYDNVEMLLKEKDGKVDSSRDGLNSVDFNLLKVDEHPLYTWLLIDVLN